MFGFSLGIFFLFVVEKSKMIAHAVKRATAIEGPSGAIPVGCPFSVSFDGIFIHIRVVVPLAVVRPHMIHTEPEVVPELRGGPWRTEFTGQVATRVFAASVRSSSRSIFLRRRVMSGICPRDERDARTPVHLFEEN